MVKATTTTTPTPEPIPAPPVHSSTPKSWQAWFTSIVAFVVGIVDAVHPGWSQPVWVSALVPSVSIACATGVQIFDFVTKRSVQKARLAAGKPA